MITAETRTTVHESWCSAHVDPNPEEGLLQGWCASASRTMNDVEVQMQTSPTGPGVEVYSLGERLLTPREARQVAAEIVRASLIAEGKGGSGAVLAANLVSAVAEATPLDTDALEVFADTLGVSAVSLLA